MKKLAQDTKTLLEEIQDLRLSLFKNISFDSDKSSAARKNQIKTEASQHQ